MRSYSMTASDTMLRNYYSPSAGSSERVNDHLSQSPMGIFAD